MPTTKTKPAAVVPPPAPAANPLSAVPPEALAAFIQQIVTATQAAAAPAPSPLVDSRLATVATNLRAQPTTPAAAANVKPPCTHPGCSTPQYAKFLCTKHYHRQLRHRKADGVPDRVNNAVPVASTVPTDVYRSLEEAAARNGLSLFRTIRWVLNDWAEADKRRPSVMSIGQTLPGDEE